MEEESFGSRSRLQRKQLGITLDDISQSTKIKVDYLLAIEQERLEDLPGGIIRRGFVRAYAKCIRFDDERAIDAFLAAGEPNKKRPIPIPKQQTVVQRWYDRALRLPLWGLAAGFLAIGFGLVGSGRELRQRFDLFSNPPPIVLRSETPPLHTVHNNRAEETQTDNGAASEEVASAHLVPKTEAPQLASSSALRSLVSAQPDTFALLIKVREDAWISIIADGQRILSETMVAASEQLVKAHTHIVVRAGNIGAVDFTFNGKRLPTQGDYNEARTLDFDANGLQSRPPEASYPEIPRGIPVPPKPLEQ